MSGIREMPPNFDPYYEWLGIPPEEQPPHLYRLLGLSLFESHPAVITNAADRIMADLKKHELGLHSAASQRLLSEVARAKIILLGPERKQAYDEQLWQALNPSPAPAFPVEQAEPAEIPRFPDLQDSRPAKPKKKKKKSKKKRQSAPPWLVGVLSSAIVLAVLLALYLYGRGPVRNGRPPRSQTKLRLPGDQRPSRLPISHRG